MPEVQEVFHIATQKIRPDPGARERQFQGQRRRAARRKAGAIVLVAAIVLVGGLITIEALRAERGENRPAAPSASPQMTLHTYGMGFSGDGTKILASDGNSVQIYDAATGELVGQPFPGDSSGVFSPDGDLFADGTKVYETVTWREVLRLQRPSQWGGLEVAVPAFSPDGSRIAIAPGGNWTGNRVVAVYDVQTGARERNILTPGYTPRFAGPVFSPDGRQLAVAWREKGIVARVFDLYGGGAEPVVTLRGEGEGNWAMKMAWSPDGSTLITVGLNEQAVVWDAVTGEMRFTIPSPSGRFASVAFGSDPTRFATGSDDGTVIVWALTTDGARPIMTRHVEIREKGYSRLISVALNPNGTQLMVAVGYWGATFTAKTIVWAIP